MPGHRSVTGMLSVSRKLRSRSIILILQQPPKALPPYAQMNRDGGSRRPEDPTDLSRWVSTEVEQHDGRTLLRAESRECFHQSDGNIRGLDDRSEIEIYEIDAPATLLHGA